MRYSDVGVLRFFENEFPYGLPKFIWSSFTGLSYADHLTVRSIELHWSLLNTGHAYLWVRQFSLWPTSITCGCGCFRPIPRSFYQVPSVCRLALVCWRNKGFRSVDNAAGRFQISRSRPNFKLLHRTFKIKIYHFNAFHIEIMKP